jgi:hypothetical protein
MPPAKNPTNVAKPASKPESEYAWIAAGMHGVSHVELISRGGFGEVHKVILLFIMTLTIVDEKREI